MERVRGEVLLTAGAVAALALGLAPNAQAITIPTFNDNVQTAGQTGPGIVVVPLDQTVTATNSVTFGAFGLDNFTASLSPLDGNLDLTADAGSIKVVGCTGTECPAPPQLYDLALGDSLSNGVPSTVGEEYGTASFDQLGKTVFYSLEFFTPQEIDQGWLEISFDDPTLDAFAYGVPEPGSLSLFAVGASALLLRRRRKSA